MTGIYWNLIGQKESGCVAKQLKESPFKKRETKTPYKLWPFNITNHI